MSTEVTGEPLTIKLLGDVETQFVKAPSDERSKKFDMQSGVVFAVRAVDEGCDDAGSSCPEVRVLHRAGR